MNPLVAWVAELLAAAWQRQEHEGRYRGADDFRALHIDPADAVASWRAAIGDETPWPDAVAAGFAGLDVVAGLGLSPADRLLAALAAAVEVEPRLRPLVAALTDDPALRLPTVGLACEVAPAVGIAPADVRAAVAPSGRLGFLCLVRTEPAPGRPSPLDAHLVASPWLVDRADGVPLAKPADLVRADAEPWASGRGPVLCTGADHARHAAAAGWGSVLPADAADEPSLGEAARAALLAGAALLVRADSVPEPWLVTGLERAVNLGCPAGVSLAAGVTWVPPARWRHVEVTPAGVAGRAERWTSALAASGLRADSDAVAQVSVEYGLGLDAIDDAAARAAAQAGDGASVTLAALRVAARRTAWRDLSSCARPGPTGNTWADLVVPDGVRRQLLDVAAAIGQRGRVLDEWGFGGRPGSRGYHVLFAGPSGTGKTMSAGVIAEATGLELWVVDLARVVDKYLGETEKAIDKVLRAAEASGAMLLFDEADALFGRRGEVKEAKDRWANVEVAFLLQRIEEHDGVTVLTTNVSHHLDEAFARRMSQRVEFTVPDARLRRTLWLRSIPDAAPLADPADLATVAEHFELAGGAIRTAALNAAYSAAADEVSIGLPQLVRASVRELSKAGRTPTRADLGDLGVHLGEAG